MAKAAATDQDAKTTDPGAPVPPASAPPPKADGPGLQGPAAIPGYLLSPWPGPFVLPPGAWLRQTNPGGACGIRPGLYRVIRVSYDRWVLIDMDRGTAVDEPAQLPHDGLSREAAAQLLRGEQYLEHWEALRRSPLDGVA